MDAQKIANEINYDIEIGIYSQFEKLKITLEGIAHRLVKSVYVENSEVSESDLQVLKDNDYI